MAGQVEPSAARVRFVASEIEVRAGNLGAARSLLEAAVKAEPSTSAYTTLALVERQAGDGQAALADVDRALRAPDARGALADVAEAYMLAFELHRDLGHPDLAKASLDAALGAVLAARQQRAGAAARARTERLLGRILDGYGDARGAARALERALTLAAGDRPSLGPAMLDAIGRALLRRDLPSAQAALKRGLEGEVGEDDLVYGGLWVLLLERELKVPADPAVERALRASGGHPSWTGKLAAWANGKMTDADLSTAAQSAAQRVEAGFYTAMARKVAGDPAAETSLRAIATSPVIDLIEVQLAREMLAPRMRADLPGNVQLP
jgi:tetratricopeptide (TPR) repeat protein